MPEEDVPSALIEQRIRNRRIQYLEFVADAQGQLEYQRKVPHVSVSNEIVNQWYDWTDAETGEPASSQGLYTFEEREALYAYWRVIRAVEEATPQTIPPIDEFQATDAWRMLQASAARSLAVFTR